MRVNEQQLKELGMARVVIIGAGLTGLSVAYHLEQNGFYDYQIFEKESRIGGLCKSVQQDGFTFDYTGHLLHCNDSYFRTFLESTIGMDALCAIERRSWVYSHGVYTPYPYQQYLHGLPPHVIVECIDGYVNRPTRTEGYRSFRDWVLQEFGEGFGNHFFFPYQSKIFAYDIDHISASWTGRFVPNTTLKQILQGAFGCVQPQAVGYNAQFWYPKQGGIEAWLRAIAQCLKNPVKMLHAVDSIDVVRKKIHFTNSHTEQYDTLISTMPLDHCMRFMRGSDDLLFKHAAKNLHCNSVMNINLGIARDDISDKHWIYFPEREYQPYRIGFPHNFTSHMVPEGASSLYAEYAFMPDQVVAHTERIESTIRSVQKLLSIGDLEIKTTCVLEIPHAYVIYDAWRDEWVPKIHERLRQEHIASIGRYGAWKYSSMQEAVLEGKAEAEKILKECSTSVCMQKNIQVCEEQ